MPPVMEGEGVIQSRSSQSSPGAINYICMPIHELVAAPSTQDFGVPPSEDYGLDQEDNDEPLEAVPPSEDQGLVYD